MRLFGGFARSFSGRIAHDNGFYKTYNVVDYTITLIVEIVYGFPSIYVKTHPSDLVETLGNVVRAIDQIFMYLIWPIRKNQENLVTVENRCPFSFGCLARQEKFLGLDRGWR